MRPLRLSLKNIDPEKGLNNIELEYSWNDSSLKFVDSVNAGLFADVQAAQKNGENKILIGGTAGDSDLDTDGDFINLNFEFTDNVEKDVELNLIRCDAENSDGGEVLVNVPKKLIYDASEGNWAWVLDYVW